MGRLNEVVLEARDWEGRTVRFLRRQFEHVSLRRPWIGRRLSEVAETLSKPDMVLRGAHGEYMASKYFADLLGGKHLLVTYRLKNNEAFIITVFPTSDIERVARRRAKVWSR